MLNEMNGGPARPAWAEAMNHRARAALPPVLFPIPPRTRVSESAAEAGFTLLEIVVALALLGVFSLLAFQGLSRMVDGSTALKSSLNRIEDVGRAWVWLDETCARALLLRLPPLPPEPPYGDEADPPGFIAEIWRPVAEAGAPPQRVLLALADGRLSATLSTVGRREQHPPILLLDGVARCSLRALDGQLQAAAQWPPRQATERNPLPRAMELSLTLDDGRQFKRLFAPR